MIARLMFRLRWYRASLAYDDMKRHGQPKYLLMFTRPRNSCTHRSLRLGLPCLREPTYDGWCGLHNSMCWAHQHDVNRCDGQLRDSGKPKARR